MSEWWSKKFDEYPVMTESEKVVVDLLLSGVPLYLIPHHLGMRSGSDFVDWRYESNHYGALGRVLLINCVEDFVEEKKFGSRKDRVASIDEALLKYRDKVRNEAIENLIEESQEDDDGTDL